MKQKSFLVTILFALTFTLASCSGDDELNTIDESTYPVQIPIDTNIVVDLNNDGAKESISYIVDKSKNINKARVNSFKIDNIEYKDKLYGELELYMCNPNSQWYYIVDIDVADDYKEIAILDDGPSADPQTYFFRYDGHELIYIGSISGFPHYERFKFNENGTIISSFHLTILQTWTAPTTWKLDESGFLIRENEDIYYPYKSNALRQKVNKDIFIYKKPELTSEQIFIPAGSTVTLVSTDNKHWVSIKTDDGTEGWLYMEDYSNILINGIPVDSRLIFNNLYFAG
ncbi:SH3 domain-containing protein [Sedimentibacter sp. zth1]|uniref:SH3 domain-containing protein n=1 Tax=Sedimentibacter sp. zth1 TaxID=2816908 RepID=UPI001A935A4A|nr:SH3 domain-containing protein [Sedimentibacter sp. zth1]QSX06251.1 SH3 domain-containing protein [Sedimentibacter sp. zth1]